MAAQAVFTWEAAVAIAYTALWNLGLYLFNTRSPVWRRCSHLNLSLVSNKKQGHVAGPPQTWFGWDLICAKDLLDGPIGVLGLLLFRVLELVVFLFTIIFGNIIYDPAGGSFFIYFTNWTFVAFGLTGLLGVAITARELIRRKRPTIPCIETNKPVSSTHAWNPALRFYHLLLTTTCSASVMLTIFYWFADYMPGGDLRFDNPVKHGASSFLLLLDVGLSRMPLVSYHLQVVVAYGSAYLAFLWIYYGVTGSWVYRALDWTKFKAVPYYFALPVLLLLGFAVMFAVAAIRELCLNKCKCQQQPDEEIIMAKQQDGTWIPMDNVTTWHGPQEQQITPRSPRLAIAFGQ